MSLYTPFRSLSITSVSDLLQFTQPNNDYLAQLICYSQQTYDAVMASVERAKIMYQHKVEQERIANADALGNDNRIERLKQTITSSICHGSSSSPCYFYRKFSMSCPPRCRVMCYIRLDPDGSFYELHWTDTYTSQTISYNLLTATFQTWNTLLQLFELHGIHVQQLATLFWEQMQNSYVKPPSSFVVVEGEDIKEPMQQNSHAEFPYSKEPRHPLHGSRLARRTPPPRSCVVYATDERDYPLISHKKHQEWSYCLTEQDRNYAKSLLNDDVFVVDEICACRSRNGIQQYFIKWKTNKYPHHNDQQNTWEPQCNILDPSLIKVFNFCNEQMNRCEYIWKLNHDFHFELGLNALLERRYRTWLCDETCSSIVEIYPNRYINFDTMLHYDECMNSTGYSSGIVNFNKNNNIPNKTHRVTRILQDINKDSYVDRNIIRYDGYTL